MEQRAVAQGVPLAELMARAGAGAAQCILRRWGDRPGHILILCGKGNNGGDGFVAAAYFARHGRTVDVLCVDGAPAAELARQAAARLENEKNVRRVATDELCVENYAVVVDAVYGIGYHGALAKPVAALFRMVNEWPAVRVALDLPSGTECDTGSADPDAFRASATVTFLCRKPVHIHAPGDACCGEVHLLDLGVKPEWGADVPVESHLLEAADIAALLPPRRADSNKGTYGRALCVVGSYGMAGAAALAASGALRSGCGLVQLAVPRSVYPLLASAIWEAVYTPVPEKDGHFSLEAVPLLQNEIPSARALLIGCGMTACADTERLTVQLLSQAKIPAVVDADGINVLAAHKDILRARTAATVLTPHPGEMARLTGRSVAEIQGNRTSAAQAFAREHGVVLVLKGHHTVVAAPDGRVCICPTGNSGMAKGGSGDLLAGIVVSLLAQGSAPFDAACAAVYLHGLAGDLCAAHRTARAMLPSDMLHELPAAFAAVEFRPCGSAERTDFVP